MMPPCARGRGASEKIRPPCGKNAYSKGIGGLAKTRNQHPPSGIDVARTLHNIACIFVVAPLCFFWYFLCLFEAVAKTMATSIYTAEGGVRRSTPLIFELILTAKRTLKKRQNEQ